MTTAAVDGASLALLGPLALACERALDRLEMGDDVAAGLGVRAGALRLGAVAGPTGLAAFVAGPLGRRLAGAPGAAFVPAALTVAPLLVVADLAARSAFAPAQLPAGLSTAGFGASHLPWLPAAQVRRGAL